MPPELRSADVQQWLVFATLVTAMLSLDLLVLHRRDRAASPAESTLWVLFWCVLAGGFDALVWRWRSQTAAMQFLAGYLLEWSLSVDNLFVFAVVFRYFQVPRQYQYRVLFWGILARSF